MKSVGIVRCEPFKRRRQGRRRWLLGVDLPVPMTLALKGLETEIWKT